MKKRIVLTGGHLSPALALLPKLAKNKNAEIIFIGRKTAQEGDRTPSAEYLIIKEKMKIPFYPLITGRIRRLLDFRSLISLLKIPIGFIHALIILLRVKPQIILSFGGYIGFPVVFWGKILGVKTIIHEQTSIPGLAIKLSSFFSDKICLSFPGTERFLPRSVRKRIILTGNPLREEIFRKETNDRNLLKLEKPVIYITGGSLGSHSINLLVKKIIKKLLEKYSIIHQCGSSFYGDYERLKVLRSKLPTNLQRKYYLSEYIDADNIGWVLNSADLIIGRSGANTVWELAALGKPCLFIPLPWSGGKEQIFNAKFLGQRKQALVLDQKKINSTILLQKIIFMMENLEKFKKSEIDFKNEAVNNLLKLIYELAERP